MTPADTVPAYFFGVCPGSRSGHYCHVPGLGRWRNDDPLTPWVGKESWWGPIGETTALEACWDKRDGQPEGEPRFDRRDGWTLVAMWDRSADKRMGCCAIFAFQRDLTDPEALALARELFPRVFARIEKHLGRPVRLEPVCCPMCRRPLGGDDDPR
jgi:hypothetical protein